MIVFVVWVAAALTTVGCVVVSGRADLDRLLVEDLCVDDFAGVPDISDLDDVERLVQVWAAS